MTMRMTTARKMYAPEATASGMPNPYPVCRGRPIGEEVTG
jgi:hypothetical protein